MHVNERVSSHFWCDSCCMTKYDQITSGVSHRHITEGTGESSSRNFVFLYFLFLKCFGIFWTFKIFVTSDKRGGTMPIYGKWVCLWPYMVTPQRHGFFGVNKTDHSLLLSRIDIKCSFLPWDDQIQNLFLSSYVNEHIVFFPSANQNIRFLFIKTDISSCQSYNDTYDLWVSVTLIVNGVSPYISHITKYTGLRQFEKCYNVISPMFLFNCPNFDL